MQQPRHKRKELTETAMVCEWTKQRTVSTIMRKSVQPNVSATTSEWLWSKNEWTSEWFAYVVTIAPLMYKNPNGMLEYVIVWRVLYPFMKIVSCCVLVWYVFFLSVSIAAAVAAATVALSSFDHFYVIYLVDWQKCLFQRCFSLRHLAIQTLLDVKCFNLFTSTLRYDVYDCHQAGRKPRERWSTKKEREWDGQREKKPLKPHIKYLFVAKRTSSSLSTHVARKIRKKKYSAFLCCEAHTKEAKRTSQ